MNPQQLRRKGWSEEEIKHLGRHFSSRKEGWLLMALLFVLLLFAVLAVPYAYALIAQVIPSLLLYVTLLLVGTGLGAVFGILLTDFDRLAHHHHLILSILLPLVAVVAMIVEMRSVSSGLFAHNAYIASAIYAVGFVIPYALLILRRWNLQKQ